MTLQHGSQSSPRHTPLRLLGRFVSGRPLDGIHRTDATFLRRATRDLTLRGRASHWHHQEGYKRASWRIGIALVIAIIFCGLAVNQTATVIGLIISAIAGSAFGTWRGRISLLDWSHHRKLVIPLYQTSTLITGQSVVFGRSHGDNHKKYIHVPRDFRTNDKARIRFVVPETWEAQPGQQARLRTLITQRLGGDWDMIPKLTEYPPSIEFVKSPAPPDKVTFADIKSALEKGSLNIIILGIGTRDKIISINLDSESPHIAISMGTGGGKTSLIRLIVAYLMRHGCERIDIIDPKRVSHNWARDIPGVYIHRTMTKQMEAIHNFRLRMESRYDALDTDDTLTFPRHVLIIEEQNSWMGYAQTYWADYRRGLEPAERGKVPPRNPAVADLGFCLFQGRQANMNIFSIYQRQSAAASGGGDLRENYGALLAARMKPQTWKILTGSSQMPKEARSRINGRGIFVLGDEYHPVQFAYLREAKEKDWPGVPRERWIDEAYEYAMSGVRARADQNGQGTEPGNLVSVPEPASQPDMPGSRGDGSDEPVTLREAIDAGIVPMRYPALRKARQRAERDGNFPAGIPGSAGTAYKPSDLRAWFATRGRSRSPVPA